MKLDDFLDRAIERYTEVFNEWFAAQKTRVSYCS